MKIGASDFRSSFVFRRYGLWHSGRKWLPHSINLDAAIFLRYFTCLEDLQYIHHQRRSIFERFPRKGFDTSVHQLGANHFISVHVDDDTALHKLLQAFMKFVAGL